MIKIGKPYLKSEDGHTRLCAEIDRDGEKRTLWFGVEDKFAKYLLVERSDAFVIGLLNHAIQYGHDITSDAPMTRRIYEQLTEQFLPCLNRMHGDFKRCKGHAVRISCDVADEMPALGDAVGTGISCGVDSLHVFASHSDITHACIWNMHGVTNDETAEKRQIGWKNLMSQAHRFSVETGHELIIGDTNFDRGCFSNLAFDGSTTYGNLFAIQCLQKLWRKYYVASGYAIKDFSLQLGVFSDPAHYEYLLFPFVSGDHFSIRLDAPEKPRIEKIKDLIDYKPAHSFLNVCCEIHSNGKNCTYLCPKCMRTVLNLMVWGGLDLFDKVFDVQYVNAHREEFIAELYRGYLQHNPFATEMREYFAKMKIPFIIKMKAARIVGKKAILKLLRGGTTSHKFIRR